MKKLLIILIAIQFLMACRDETPKNYVSIAGKITNPASDSLVIRDANNTILKTIKLTEDGTYSDTLTVKKGQYSISDGGEYARLFLYPNSDIIMNLDAEHFDETITFSGFGSAENNYSIKKLLLQEKIFENPDDLYGLPKDSFTKALDSVKTTFNNLLAAQKDLDVDFIQKDMEDTEGLFGFLAKRYDAIAKLNTLIGKVSPQFTNYENVDGSTTSLADLKGKYVYIDVWATWCRPCLAEIPALKELEKEFGEKMHFVSISIDKEDKHDTWKKMVTDKELKGIQLYADTNWESQFVRDFGINGIPRFILIDPQGHVVKPDASRPSNPKTKELFSTLLN